MNNATTAQSFNQKLAQFLLSKPIILQICKFAAIGALNTALDFVILDYVSKSFNITSGLDLGLLNIISFSTAMIQSYLWNRAWTFSTASASPLANFSRLVVVGGLGFLTFVLAFVGGLYGAVDTYYLFILVIFLAAEIFIWYGIGLSLGNNPEAGVGHQFGIFMIVSLIGLLINSGIVIVASNALAPSLTSLINADSIKNVSKILATLVSLIWNFIGYKIFVFKK